MDKDTLVNLLKEAQNGNRDALEKLCKFSVQFVRNYFTYRFKDIETINDLCQETFIRLVNSFQNIREPTKYKNFVLKTAFYVAQDFLRTKSTIRAKISSLDDVKNSP